MNKPDGCDGARFGNWAAFVFVLGLLGPLVIILASTYASAYFWQRLGEAFVAVYLGFLAEVLAFVLGLLGRKTLLGKVGLIGSTVVLTFVALMGFLWLVLVQG
jgi:hypothetical protein